MSKGPGKLKALVEKIKELLAPPVPVPAPVPVRR